MFRKAWLLLALGLVLLVLLLCACAEQGDPAATAIGAEPSAATPTAPNLALRTETPGPPASPELADQDPTPTPFTGDDTRMNVADGTVSADMLGSADLSLQVPEVVEAVPGETTVYTLTIFNDGPDAATGIVLTDAFPAGAFPVWTQPGQPACTREQREVACELGAVPGGEAVTVTLDLSVAGTPGAAASSSLPGVVLDLPMPSCAIDREAAPPRVTCGLAHLAAGASVQVGLGAALDAQVSGPLIHAIAVSALERDNESSNNRARLTMTVGEARPEGADSAISGPDLVVLADGPSAVFAGRPFTYTYTVINRGGQEATGVALQDEVPSDLDLVYYAPGLPQCEQQGDHFTCRLGGLWGGEPLTFTLVITGHGDQPMNMWVNPVLPGWPSCLVLKERTWQHILQCELGTLRPGQTATVQMVLAAVGVKARTTSNTVSLRSLEPDLNPLDNTHTATLAIQVEPGGPD